MGIIAPKNSGGHSSENESRDALAEDVVLTTPSQSAPAGGPDAANITSEEFPFRAYPSTNLPRDNRYQVIFKQSVLDDIHAHGKSSPACEVCGVLVGDVCQDGASAPWAHVEASIRGNGAVGQQTQVTITSDTWSRIHEVLEKEHPNKKILGWYHTHPGFGIFLSGMDLFIQDNFFNQPWQVAFVYDPVGGDEGVFVWRMGKSEREPHLIENDSSGPAPVDAPADKITELTRRVAALERRIDIILTGFLCLILLALVAPLVILFVGPENIPLSGFHRSKGQPPAATQPAAPGQNPAQSQPSTGPHD